MKYIIVSHGKRLSPVDEQDYKEFREFNWSLTKGYAARGTKKNGKWIKYLLHRLILKARPGQIVDHINGDILDNRRKNLRICTKVENRQNSKKQKGSSKYRGVKWNKSKTKWEANLQYQKINYYLGTFNNEKEAGKAYNKQAKIFYGKYAKLNKI